MNSLHFYPERVVWIGMAAIGGICLFGSPFLFLLSRSPDRFFEAKANPVGEKRASALSVSLGLNANSPALPLPDLRGEMSFSFDPPRPDRSTRNTQLFVRLKKAAQSKRVSLPCRLDLFYVEDKLCFTDAESPFWMELSPAASGQIEVKVFVHCPPEGKIGGTAFFAHPEESPILSSQELPERSPFRILGEARWLGRDMFREKFAGGAAAERFDIGSASQPELFDLKEGDWIVWEEEKWQKLPCLNNGHNRPIAHIQSLEGKNLVLEGWDADHHIRLALNQAATVPMKIKGEDLFASIRVRSEKQISCMLEKQCLILKTGDWVFKSNGRWQILRKKEERDAYLKGKLVGDLFVFERIDLKQGQKMIQGHLFNPARSQAALIEIAASASRKNLPGKEVLASGEKTRKGRSR